MFMFLSFQIAGLTVGTKTKGPFPIKMSNKCRTTRLADLTLDKRLEILERYSSGLNKKLVAEEFKVSREVVSAIFKCRKLIVKKCRLMKVEVKNAKALIGARPTLSNSSRRAKAAVKTAKNVLNNKAMLPKIEQQISDPTENDNSSK